MEIVLVTRPAYSQTYIQLRTSFHGWQYAGSWLGGLTKEFLMDEGEYIKYIEILLVLKTFSISEKIPFSMIKYC